MINGRFYSRRQGWYSKEIVNTVDNCVKYYNSVLIDKLPNINLNDKDGKYIFNYLKKNNLENEYKELYLESKIYSNWYFYYNDNIKIFSSESL
jgi:hypothetical protein